MPDQSTPTPGVPSQQQQQWGVIISIFIIVVMIVVGAFYAWGQRIAEQNALVAGNASAAADAALESTTTSQ